MKTTVQVTYADAPWHHQSIRSTVSEWPATGASTRTVPAESSSLAPLLPSLAPLPPSLAPLLPSFVPLLPAFVPLLLGCGTRLPERDVLTLAAGSPLPLPFQPSSIQHEDGK